MALMASPVYATDTELEELASDAVDDAEELLSRASAHVRDATRQAVYRTDPATFLPTDLRVLAAMHDATLYQALAMHRAGITKKTMLATESGPVASKSLGGASVTFMPNQGALDARNALLRGDLVPEARQVLDDVGLLTTAILSQTPYYARPLDRIVRD